MPPLAPPDPPPDPKKEAELMAQTFYHLSGSVDDFRLHNYSELAPSKRKQLKEQSDTLQLRANEYTATAMAAILTQIAPHLDKIKQATKDAASALSTLNKVAKGLAIVDAAVALTRSIVECDVGSLGSDVDNLWKATHLEA